MILYRIDDFKSTPSWIEYISLYAICSTFIVISGYAVIGQISISAGFLALLLFLIALYIFATIKRVRQQRAIQFFCACLKDLEQKELHILAQRYRSTDLELIIIEQRLNDLNTKSRPTDLTKAHIASV